MAICSKCRRRLIFWISLTCLSIGTGLLLDIGFFKTNSFALFVRLIGIAGIILAHFLLKRTGKLLGRFGDCELWGWSTKLITCNVYGCVRHPHHLGVGMFMTFLGLAIGYPITFTVIAVTQWSWVFLFVILIEEKECLEKFGNDYREYSRITPMFFGNPVCIVKELLKIAEEPQKQGQPREGRKLIKTHPRPGQ
jgi:protein-S-isoprenylcysteine O-methyltransferase Ste14